MLSVQACAPVEQGIERALRSRRSVRAFTRKPVCKSTVRSILSAAACSPSGGNMQPWNVYVADRAVIDTMREAVLATGIPASKAAWDDYRYYPKKFFGAYDQRRKSLGRALYGLLGIERRDVGAMRRQFEANFDFFGAPVGLIVTIDRRLEKGSWLDLGMFIQSVCLAGQDYGLSTCVQAAFAPYHRTLRPILGMGDEDVLVCGISLGYEDVSKSINRLRTSREAVDHWAHFVGSD